MWLVLAVCAAPVVASYLAYYAFPPPGRTNYGTLIQPARPLPPTLLSTDVQGRAVALAALKGQWLLVVVAGGACDARCERALWIQRQLRESLGRERERVDKVWLIDDGVAPRPETLRAVEAGGAASVLLVPSATLVQWLQPEPGRRLEDHLYIVDPRGDWMMRMPVDPDTKRLQRDVEKLLRASAGWDRPGR